MTPIHFNCPICTGLFQVAADMAGGQVICPHCGQQVGIPPLTPEPVSEEGEISTSPPPVQPPQISPPQSTPPSTPDQSGPPVPEPPLPPPSLPEPTLPPSADAQHMYPPGHGAPPTPVQSDSPDLNTDKYPPGMLPPTTGEEPEEAKTVIQSQTDALPPGFDTPAETTALPSDEMLAGQRSTDEPDVASSTSQDPPVDTLLPPTSADGSLPDQSDAPTANRDAPADGVNAANLDAAKSKAIESGKMQETSSSAADKPTLKEGSFVNLREPVRTVGKGANARPLHSLNRQERTRRRFATSIVTWILCAIALAALLAYLVAFRS